MLLPSHSAAFSKTFPPSATLAFGNKQKNKQKSKQTNQKTQEVLQMASAFQPRTRDTKMGKLYIRAWERGRENQEGK